MPVALGLGEGGEFYRPLAIAIIGGTITSTLLTLLVVPTFYDSIEIARESMMQKMRVRMSRYPAIVGFAMTMLEALCTLLLLRFAYRMLGKLLALITGRGRRTVQGDTLSIKAASSEII